MGTVDTRSLAVSEYLHRTGGVGGHFDSLINWYPGKQYSHNTHIRLRCNNQVAFDGQLDEWYMLQEIAYKAIEGMKKREDTWYPI